MKSKFTKILCLVMGAILLVTGTVAATLAYMSATTQIITNTMTVGDIEIELDEAVVDLYGVKQGNERTKTGNTYKLIPGQTYTKDPVVTVVEGSEPCYVFFGVAIDSEVAKVLDASNNVIATQLKNSGWEKLMTADNKTQIVWTDDNGTAYNIYYKADVVDATSSEKSLATFTKFSVAGDADVSKADEATIKVKAFAVQSANLASPQLAWSASFDQAST